MEKFKGLQKLSYLRRVMVLSTLYLYLARSSTGLFAYAVGDRLIFVWGVTKSPSDTG